MDAMNRPAKAPARPLKKPDKPSRQVEPLWVNMLLDAAGECLPASKGQQKGSR